ncbi:MAG: TlpA family protein disulfide reductase [Nitrospinota bacterium]
MFKWIPVAILSIIALVATGLYRINKALEEPIAKISDMRQPTSKLIGLTAPSFSIPTFKGNKLSLADYEGKIVLLNFWATWCKPCVEEIPSMKELKKELNSDDFALISVSIDQKLGDITEFIKKIDIPFPIGLDPKEEVSAKYETTGIPETFLLDRNLAVIYHVAGAGDWSHPEVLNTLQRIIEETKPALTQNSTQDKRL